LNFDKRVGKTSCQFVWMTTGKKRIINVRLMKGTKHKSMITGLESYLKL